MGARSVSSMLVQNVILAASLVVSVVTLVFLVKYVRATKGIEKAAIDQAETTQELAKSASDQTKVSQELIRAANKQAEGSQAQAESGRELARWQREQWELDSRKQEWRELISTLTRCVEMIRVGQRSQNNAEWLQTVQAARGNASTVITDRLFITTEITRDGLRDKWDEIAKMPFPNGMASPDFQKKWHDLHKKLVELAQQDLESRSQRAPRSL